MNNKRRVLSTAALTALTASIVGCQTGVVPGVAGNAGINPQLGAQNAAATQNTARGRQLDQAIARGYDAMPGEFVVRMKPGVSPQSISAQSMGVQVNNVQPLGNPQSTPFALIKTSVSNGGFNAQTAGMTAQQLSQNPNVLYAEPNYLIKIDPNETKGTPGLPSAPKPAAFPNDPMFDQEYVHRNVQSQAGWANFKGNKDFVLAIVDTGVAADHPDLKAKLLPGYNTVDNNEDSDDYNGHGTHCAGSASAITNNGVGVAGIAPEAKILPVAVLSRSGSGSYASVANGIIWAADHGAKVISMSLGGPRGSQVITDAVQHALSKDAMLIAAMGNSAHGSDANPIPRKSYPAAEPGVMAVGATDVNDKIARFSQAGEWHSVSAPGVDILSTFPLRKTSMPAKDGYGSISGTSMATPAVAGLAALVRAKWPQLNAAQVEAHIEATADDLGPTGYDILYGHGRINVAKAMTTDPSMTLNAPRR